MENKDFRIYTQEKQEEANENLINILARQRNKDNYKSCLFLLPIVNLRFKRVRGERLSSNAVTFPFLLNFRILYSKTTGFLCLRIKQGYNLLNKK
jgi:hypothetical protein